MFSLGCFLLSSNQLKTIFKPLWYMHVIEYSTHYNSILQLSPLLNVLSKDLRTFFLRYL